MTAISSSLGKESLGKRSGTPNIAFLFLVLRWPQQVKKKWKEEELIKNHFHDKKENIQLGETNTQTIMLSILTVERQ